MSDTFVLFRRELRVTVCVCALEYETKKGYLAAFKRKKLHN